MNLEKGSETVKKQYTVKDVVELTGYSERTIRQWISDGIIKITRTRTNRVRIEETEIKKLFKKGE